MLSKCTNPECSARFLYLYSGKVFRLNVHPPSATSSFPHREYYWLCDDCELRMTLVFRPGLGVIAVEKEEEEEEQTQSAAAD